MRILFIAMLAAGQIVLALAAAVPSKAQTCTTNCMTGANGDQMCFTTCN